MSERSKKIAFLGRQSAVKVKEKSLEMQSNDPKSSSGRPLNNEDKNISLEESNNRIEIEKLPKFASNKKINIISHYKLEREGTECLKVLSPNDNMKGEKFQNDLNIGDQETETNTIPADNRLAETKSTACNSFFPLVIVPPKEDVANMPISEVRSIIIEEIPFDPYDTNQFFQEKKERSAEAENNTSVDLLQEHVSDSASDSNDDIQFDGFFESDDNSNHSPVNIIQNSEHLSDYEISQVSELNISKHLLANLNEETKISEDKSEISEITKTSQLQQKTVETETTEKTDTVECTKNKNYKDKKTFCFYCDKDVSHFSRHLVTWHKNDIDVQRILSYDSKSKQRRNALNALRKRGNYVNNRSNIQLRPVKRVQVSQVSSSDEFLPCPYCLGFYKRKSLYRHTKKCTERPQLVNVKRQTAQSDGQTALLMLYKHDELLKNELFPRMRADEVALIAKKDPLICNYAYTYIKGRRSKGNLDLVRQNMRRLAKLLQHARNEKTEIKRLIDLLHPKYFQVIINGVNKIGAYNSETDTYESPTVAINFGTLLKKCCDLAYIQLLQQPNTERDRKDLKILKTLIESQWANEVSAQAGTNLNEKKWNKEQLLPLTSDLKKLKDYLEAEAHKMYEELLVNEKHKGAYNTLKEVIYAQIILINRRRPAEVAQLKVETYKSVNLDHQENAFENCLTETERILLSSCSRIVIKGKRGRGVPILLLSQKMREHFDFLISIRGNFLANNEKNDYIFHTDGKTFLDGTKILHKYALKCGVENPKSISATRLRKHLATVTQLLQFSKNDLEQLSKFMGHTLKTHCDFYRLSDDIYQTAKISKLLLLATDGGLDKYKGMKLDDINIDLNPITEECDLENTFSVDSYEVSAACKPSSANSEILEVHNEQIKVLDNKTHVSKQAWSYEQKKMIAQYFFKHIKSKKAPNQQEVIQFTEEYPGMFTDRKWSSIKAVVYNMYTNKLIIPT